MMISSYCMQHKHYTLISVGPALLKSTDRLPWQALYHSHHSLVDGPAFQSVGTVLDKVQLLVIGVWNSTFRARHKVQTSHAGHVT